MICSGMRRFWQAVLASHTTASQMLPSWNRRSSDFSPQNARNSKACGGILTMPAQGHRSFLGQTKPSKITSQPPSCVQPQDSTSFALTQHKQGSPHLGVISLRTLLQRAGSKLWDKQEAKRQGSHILVFWRLSMNWPLKENEEHETQGEMRFLEQQLLGHWGARQTSCYALPGAQTGTDRESLT